MSIFIRVLELDLMGEWLKLNFLVDVSFYRDYIRIMLG